MPNLSLSLNKETPTIITTKPFLILKDFNLIALKHNSNTKKMLRVNIKTPEQ